MNEKVLRSMVDKYLETHSMHDVADIIAYLVKYFHEPIVLKAPKPTSKLPIGVPYVKPLHAPVVPETPRLCFTEHQYNTVVTENKKNDMVPVKIAGDYGFPLQHVNYAILSSSYERYVEHAKTIK